MLLRLDFKLDDKPNRILNFLAFMLNKQSNLITAWVLCGVEGKSIIWSQPIKKGTGFYRGSVANLNEANGEPYARLVYSNDILSQTNGSHGKLVDTRANFRDVEFLGSRIIQQSQAFEQMPKFLA